MSQHCPKRRCHTGRIETGTRTSTELRAAHLDREADQELHHGHYLAAERLAWRAIELREQAS